MCLCVSVLVCQYVLSSVVVSGPVSVCQYFSVSLCQSVCKFVSVLVCHCVSVPRISNFSNCRGLG